MVIEMYAHRVGLFRRNKKKSSDSMNRDEMLQIAAGRLAELFQTEGIESEQVQTENGRGLQLEDVSLLSVENVADQMEDLPPGEWENLFQRWFHSVIEALREADHSNLDPESLAALIRSRVVSTNAHEHQEYARPLAEGLVEVLCLDFPKHVVFISDKMLPDLQLPVDELFKLGRANTLSVPFEQVMEHEGVYIASGDSVFTSSKVADMPALVSQLGIEAPQGLLFGLADKSALVVAAPTAAADAGIVSQTLHKLVQAFDLDPISPEAFYWSPDGSIAPVTSTRCAENGGTGEVTVELAPDWFE